MKRRAFDHRARAALAAPILALVLLTAACGSPGGAAPDRAATVVSSRERAVVRLGEEVAVEVPPDAVPAGSRVQIVRAEPPVEHAFSPLSPLATYDVTVGDLTAFHEPLLLRFRYDPARLRDDHPHEDQLVAAYLHPELNRWVEVDAAVDADAHEVLVSTDHLTLWSLLGFADDTVTSYSPHFAIYFREGLNAPALGPNPSGDAIFDFAAEVRSALIAAYERYADGAGFKVPETSKVYIDDWGADKTAEWGWLSKNIEIPTTYSTLRELQQDAAHELFHAVQNQYVSVPYMVANRWWMEATADYAAAYVGTGHGLADALPLDFLHKPLDDGDDAHTYQVAHFVKYLVDRGASFTDLFEATMSSSDGVLAGLNAHLNASGGSLAAAYADFAYQFLFDTGVRRAGLKADVPTDLASSTDTYSRSGGPASRMVDVKGPCAASLASFRVQSDTPGPFTATVSAIEPTSDVLVRYVVASSPREGAAVAQGLLEPGTPAKVDVEDGYYVHFIATNSASGAGHVTVAIEKPDGVKSVSRSRTAGMYNGDYEATVALELESTHAFEITDELTQGTGGEYYRMMANLTEGIVEGKPATITARATISGLAFADPEDCPGCEPFIKEAYWYAPDQVHSDEVTVTVTADDGPQTRLVYELIIHYLNREGEEYRGGGATVIDLVITH